MDEKWSFVAKKEKNCVTTPRTSPGDCGTTWRSTRAPPGLSVVPGERTAERPLVTHI